VSQLNGSACNMGFVISWFTKVTRGGGAWVAREKWVLRRNKTPGPFSTYAKSNAYSDKINASIEIRGSRCSCRTFYAKYARPTITPIFGG
jgi:hypothetical protein